MAIKLKSWNDVVNEAQHRGEYDYNNDRAFCLGKGSLPWGDWVYSDAPDEEGDYFVAHSRWVRSYMVEEVDNDYCETPEPDDILRYGTVIEDDEFNHYFTHIRLISYNGKLYYHKMVAGDVVDFKRVGYPYD